MAWIIQELIFDTKRGPKWAVNLFPVANLDHSVDPKSWNLYNIWGKKFLWIDES